MANVDILITTEEDTKRRLRQSRKKITRRVAEKLAQTFKFKIVAITLREDLSVLRTTGQRSPIRTERSLGDRKYEVEIIRPR